MLTDVGPVTAHDQFIFLGGVAIGEFFTSRTDINVLLGRVAEVLFSKPALYLSQLDTADRQEPSEALAAKTTHLKEKLAKLKEEMERLKGLEAQMLAAPDQQISLTDPDPRSMATSGRCSGVVGYNVQVAVDTENHLIIPTR